MMTFTLHILYKKGRKLEHPKPLQGTRLSSDAAGNKLHVFLGDRLIAELLHVTLTLSRDGIMAEGLEEIHGPGGISTFYRQGWWASWEAGEEKKA